MLYRVISKIESAQMILRVPGDKSISHRAAIIGAIAEGQTYVDGFLASEDCLNTVRALRSMGARIAREGDALQIDGVGLDGLREPGRDVGVGNSGTGIRLLAGLVAGQPFRIVLTGDASVRSRPMDRIIQPLRLMGAGVHGDHGDTRAPLRIDGGNLTGIQFGSPVASAQVKSAILLAGLRASGTTSVTEPSLSRDHTERMLTAFGAVVERDGTTVALGPNPVLRGRRVRVPGDISSAAFFIVAGLLVPGSELVIERVGVNPTRTGIIDALRAMGGDIETENEGDESGEPIADLRVRTSRLHGAVFDGDMIVRMIDEIPILALAASQADGETVVKDAAELRVKESDRILTIHKVLGLLGVTVEPATDGFRICGPQRVRGGVCGSCGDHRIAMTAAVAGLVAGDRVTVQDAACVDTSFPTFWETLGAL